MWDATDIACAHFEGWPSTVNSTTSNMRPHTAVEGCFEGWRLTVNSSTSNTRPHRAVGPPLSPGGAREGWGESGGCSARIATQSIAAYAGPARAGGSKPLQRPCGTRLQKLQRLVHSPPLHPRRGGKGSSTTVCGQRCVWGGVHAQTPTFKLAGNQGNSVSARRH